MRISDWSSDVCSSDLFAGLKEGVSTVFLCLPPDRLDAYSRWLRLLIAQALTDMARSAVKPARPVLFLLEELAALGRLEPAERAMGLRARSAESREGKGCGSTGRPRGAP